MNDLRPCYMQTYRQPASVDGMICVVLGNASIDGICLDGFAIRCNVDVVSGTCL